jgi:hypothetical protein
MEFALRQVRMDGLERPEADRNGYNMRAAYFFHRRLKAKRSIRREAAYWRMLTRTGHPLGDSTMAATDSPRCRRR